MVVAPLSNIFPNLSAPPRLRVKRKQRVKRFKRCRYSLRRNAEDREARRHGGVLGFWEKARGGRATFIFSLKLSNCHIVILSNCHNVSTQRAVAPFSNIFPNLSASPFSPASVLGVSNECNDLNVAAIAFGETRRTKRTETRRVFWGVVMIACTFSPCLRTPC